MRSAFSIQVLLGAYRLYHKETQTGYKTDSNLQISTMEEIGLLPFIEMCSISILRYSMENFRLPFVCLEFFGLKKKL